jgi:phosphate transport system substrate-binding protein
VLPLALLSVALLTACNGTDTQHVRLAGAQVPVELVESWLGRAREPRIETERTQFYLSQQGFESLLAGDCDLACTDRPIGASERAKFGDKQPEGYRVAFYGYALYVHPDNPLDSIYAGHLKLLFQNQIYDWKELGGKAGPIRIYGPRKGTRGGAVLMKQANIWLAEPTWIALDDDQQIIDRVADDPQALGFASVGYDQGVRYLGLRMQRNGPAALPSFDEIESGQYGLAKVIFLYVMPFENPAADAAIDYLFGEQGRETIKRTGVWPVPWERAATGPLRRQRE